MGELSPMHWLVVLIVVLLLFGPKKLPELARAAGASIREFKRAFSEGADPHPEAGAAPITAPTATPPPEPPAQG